MKTCLRVFRMQQVRHNFFICRKEMRELHTHNPDLQPLPIGCRDVVHLGSGEAEAGQGGGGAAEGLGGPGGSRSETRWCRHSSQYIYRCTDLTLSPRPPLQVKLVSCSELTLAQSSRGGVIVVDIRPEGEYEKVCQGRGRSPDVRWGA